MHLSDVTPPPSPKAGRTRADSERSEDRVPTQAFLASFARLAEQGALIDGGRRDGDYLDPTSVVTSERSAGTPTGDTFEGESAAEAVSPAEPPMVEGAFAEPRPTVGQPEGRVVQPAVTAHRPEGAERGAASPSAADIEENGSPNRLREHAGIPGAAISATGPQRPTASIVRDDRRAVARPPENSLTGTSPASAPSGVFRFAGGRASPDTMTLPRSGRPMDGAVPEAAGPVRSCPTAPPGGGPKFLAGPMETSRALMLHGRPEDQGGRATSPVTVAATRREPGAGNALRGGAVRHAERSAATPFQAGHLPDGDAQIKRHAVGAAEEEAPLESRRPPQGEAGFRMVPGDGGGRPWAESLYGRPSESFLSTSLSDAGDELAELSAARRASGALDAGQRALGGDATTPRWTEAAYRTIGASSRLGAKAALVSDLAPGLSELGLADAGLTKDASPQGVVEETAAGLAPSGASSAAGTPGTAASAQSPVAAQGAAVTAQLAAAVSRSAEGTLEVRLDPQELGRVKLGLSGSSESLTVTIIAERPETLELIRRNLESFSADLADMGFAGLNFEMGTGQQGHPVPDRDSDLAEAEAPATAELPAHSVGPRHSTGGMDLRL